MPRNTSRENAASVTASARLMQMAAEIEKLKTTSTDTVKHNALAQPASSSNHNAPVDTDDDFSDILGTTGARSASLSTRLN
ncbi:MAG: hypothetical protein ACKVON_04960 [Beijerinckiaceae bacterium]